MSGASDLEIFNYSCDKELILLTFDTTASSGVVIELIGRMEKEEIAGTILAFFSKQIDLRRKLVIIVKTKVRVVEH